MPNDFYKLFNGRNTGNKAWLVQHDFSKLKPVWSPELAEKFGEKNQGFRVDAADELTLRNRLVTEHNLTPRVLKWSSFTGDMKPDPNFAAATPKPKAQESFSASMFKVTNRFKAGTTGNAAVKKAEAANDQAVKDAVDAVTMAPTGKEKVSAAFKKEQTKKQLRDTLRDVAGKNNGFLPMSKHPTQKEIDMAKEALPDASESGFADGFNRDGVVPKGISKGKKIKFKLKRAWAFDKDKNGKKESSWIPPLPVEHENFLK